MAEDRNTINKLIKEAGCSIGVTSDSLEGIIEQRNTWKVRTFLSPDYRLLLFSLFFTD